MQLLISRRCRRFSLTIFAAAAAACVAAPRPEAQPAEPAAPPPTPPAAAALEPGSAPPIDAQSASPPIDLAEYAPSGNVRIDRWRADFHQRAVAAGRDPVIVRSLLDGVRPLDIYLAPKPESAVSAQAEFAKPIWEYLRTAVSADRRQTGRERVAGDPTLFEGLEARFGVDRNVLAAIWGMETNFGGYIGDFDAAETLANMAAEGRRRAFAESELLALMLVLERGEIRRDELTAGWAGAMGQTQFMPSTFLNYAVDWTGDGRKDVWRSEADALASAANYLAQSGYRPGEPWGVEATVPLGFDYGLADGSKRRLAEWRAAGVTAPGGGDLGLDLNAEAELWLPAGADGPKFLLLTNFNVFKAYNRADSYALAVGLLSDAIGGRSALSTPWPTDVQLLSVAQIKSLQSNLNALGFDAGPVDGIAGRGTRGALRRFQKANGLLADGFPSARALATVEAAARS